MKKAICIKGFRVPVCDEDGYDDIDGEHMAIKEGSEWYVEEGDYRFVDGEVRLTNDDLQWLEMPEEKFAEYFEIEK